MPDKRVAILEFTTYHQECLYSQIKMFSEAGYKVTLIVNPKLLLQIEAQKNRLEHIRTYDPRAASFILGRIFNWLKLFNYLKATPFERIIFNTASSNKEIIALALLISPSSKCYGIIHNLKKLNQSFSQKLISTKINRYFVLNDFLLNSVNLNNKNIYLESFYPIFFPEYGLKENIVKSDNIWISIPGEINFDRRDYVTFIEGVKKMNPENKIKFILLGKANKNKRETRDFLNTIEQSGIIDHFQIFDEFLEDPDFHTYLKLSDYIMAPVSLAEQGYLKYKITGAFNLAFAYQKPLICPSSLKIISDLNQHAHFYENSDSLALIFDMAANRTLPPKKDYEDEKWRFSYQQNKYLKFLKLLPVVE